MEYIHVKNIEKYHPDIRSEAQFEKYIINNWNEFFQMRLLSIRNKISKKSIVDLLAVKDDTNIIIELKSRPFRKKDVKQLKRYLKEYKKTNKKTIGYLIGFDRMNLNIKVSGVII